MRIRAASRDELRFFMKGWDYSGTIAKQILERKASFYCGDDTDGMPHFQKLEESLDCRTAGWMRDTVQKRRCGRWKEASERGGSMSGTEW